jgi:hypothetical protein
LRRRSVCAESRHRSSGDGSKRYSRSWWRRIAADASSDQESGWITIDDGGVAMTDQVAPIISRWRGAALDVVFAGIAAGRPDALGELFDRHGCPAVETALRCLLDAEGDEALVLAFLRTATAAATPITSAYLPSVHDRFAGGG